jgi:arylsulfatase A-like enzyme
LELNRLRAIRRLELIGFVLILIALGLKTEFALAKVFHYGRPNIIVIVTDDQRWDALGSSGNPIIQTPNLDRLAEAGIRFTNTFATSPICAASRASIFTGLFERMHRFNFGDPSLAKRFVRGSYPYLLRQAGYKTGFVGKFGIFVEDEDLPTMFDFYNPLDRTPYFKNIDGSRRHVTDICGDVAISFLRQNQGKQPFCLSISFNAPHAEDSDPQQYYWPPSSDHLYRDVSIPKSPTAAPVFFHSQPEFLKNSLNRVRWKWRFDTPQKYQAMVKGYYRMISGVDHVVGRIMHELSRLNLDKNTVVIFTSDNGYFLGERGFAGKWLMYEPSIRIPLIIKMPQSEYTRKGRIQKQLALNVDIAPTILSLAGVPVPSNVQGLNLGPLLEGKKVAWRSEVLCEQLYAHPQIPLSDGIRTQKWKYIRYPRYPGYEELYNLDHDPFEMHNLAENKQYQPQLMNLRQKRNQLLRAYSPPKN